MRPFQSWIFPLALLMAAVLFTPGSPARQAAWADSAPAASTSPAPAAAHAKKCCPDQTDRGACAGKTDAAAGKAKLGHAACTAKTGGAATGKKSCVRGMRKSPDHAFHIYHRGDNDKDRYLNEWGQVDAIYTHPTGWYSHDSDSHNPTW